MMSVPRIFEKSVILLATLLSLATMQTESMALCSEESDSNICSKEPDYNKYRNPDYPNPTSVHLDIIIRNILDLDEEKHLFEIVASSNARWREKRIDIRSISVTNPQSVRPTEAELNEVWTTNPTYPNAAIVSKRFTYNTATRDKLSGSIWFKYTMVYKSFLTCAMDFSNYPFDSHICFWKLRSHYENTIDTEKLVIDTLQSEQDSKMASQDQPLIIDSNTLPYEIEISIGQEGIDLAEDVNKSTASVQFKFTRKDEGRNELLTGYFVPTGLFATLSLVSYLIKPEIVPGRMGMLVVLFLILTNIHGTVKGPSSRGFSYIEVWYVGMFIPIVVAIIEYAAVLAAMKYKTETQYDSIICCGKTKMKRMVAHIDLAFMLFNFLFLVCFILGFFIKILSL